YKVASNKLTLQGLPIDVKSMTPYKAIILISKKNTYLEIFKAYIQGYKATINGENVSVLSSSRHLVMLPLKEGLNIINLRYVGTIAMNVAFYISIMIWFSLII